MCFLSPSGGGSGDITQNSYYNSHNRPWDDARMNNPYAPGPAESTSPSINTGQPNSSILPVGASSPKKSNRSSLTTGGSA